MPIISDRPDTIPTHIKQLIQEHCDLHPEQESCGLLVEADGDRLLLLAAENRSDTPHLDAEISAMDFARAASHGEIVGVYHSHIAPDDIELSIDDVKVARSEKLVMICYNVPQRSLAVYNPNEPAPFVGRQWHWTWQNCYDLMRDWYSKQLGIELPDIYLSAPDAWQREDVGYVANLPLHGFTRIDAHEDWSIGQLRTHDVILMYGGSTYPNHVGIVVDPAKNHLLHHTADRLSELTVYGGWRMKTTHSIWRHQANA